MSEEYKKPENTDENLPPPGISESSFGQNVEFLNIEDVERHAEDVVNTAHADIMYVVGPDSKKFVDLKGGLDAFTGEYKEARTELVDGVQAEAEAYTSKVKEITGTNEQEDNLISSENSIQKAPLSEEVRQGESQEGEMQDEPQEKSEEKVEEKKEKAEESITEEIKEPEKAAVSSESELKLREQEPDVPRGPELSQHGFNSHAEKAEMEAEAIKHELIPDSSLARLREKLPAAFHSTIDKLEAKSEAKQVVKLRKLLDHITAQQKSTGLEQNIHDGALKENNNRIEAIRQDAHMSADEKAHIIEKLEKTNNDIEKKRQTAIEKLNSLNARYDLNQGEMKAYEGRRNEAVDRVSRRIEEKIQPRQQKFEELTRIKKICDGHIAAFRKSTGEFGTKIGQYKTELGRLSSKDKKQASMLNKLIVQAEKQIKRNEASALKQKAIAFKIEKKILPLKGTLDRWRIDRDAFLALKNPGSQSYEKREEAQPEIIPESSSVERQESEENLTEETPIEISNSEERNTKNTPESESQEAGAEDVEAPLPHTENGEQENYATAEAGALPEQPSEQAYEYGPENPSQFMPLWNKYVGDHNLSQLRISPDTIHGALKTDIETAFSAIHSGADMNLLTPTELFDYAKICLEFQKRDQEMKEAVQREARENRTFKPSITWEDGWKRTWQKEWRRKRGAFGLGSSKRRAEREEWERTVEDAFDGFWDSATNNQ